MNTDLVKVVQQPELLAVPPAIELALSQGAALAISLSGGKDSQALLMLLAPWFRQRGYGGCLSKAGSHKKYCCKHHHQALKRRDPISYIYSHRKQRAKARGHAWDLTLENFRDWCEWTGYHLKTGRTPESASIDRKLNQYGYHVWNLACIPLGANAAKYTHAYGGEWGLGADASYHYEPASAADAAYYAAAEASSRYEFSTEPAPF